MSNEWLVALAPLFGLAGNVLTQVFCAHAFRRPGPSIVAGVFAGLAATMLVTAMGTGSAGGAGERLAVWAVALATNLALAYGYWTFVNMNITSLRIRTLREILHAGDTIKRDELMKLYTPEEFLSRRLERLERGKQMTCVNGRWRLEAPGLLIVANVISTLRSIALPSRAHPDA